MVLVAVIGAGLVIAACGGQSRTSSTSTTSTAARINTTPGDLATALVARDQSAIVRIETTTCSEKVVGTGFIVGPRTIATVEHVVSGATSITLKQNGRVIGHGTVIGNDTSRDVALVRSSLPLHGTELHLAARPPKLAEPVAVLGFPFGLPLTVTKGSVSGLGRTVQIGGTGRRNMVQTDAAVNPGNSGGPLISTDTGEVVGLVDIGARGANGIAFAVSADVARPLVQAWQVAPQPVSTPTCQAPSTTVQAQAPSTTTPAQTTPATPTSPGTAPAAYVREICDAVGPFERDVQSRSAALQGETIGDARAGRAALISFLGAVVADTEAALSRLAAAGNPAVPGGADIQSRLMGAFTALKDDLESAQSQADGLPVNNAAAFRAASVSLGSNIQSSMRGIGSSLNGLQSPALEAAAASEPACRSLRR